MVVLGDRSFELPVTTFSTNGPPGTPISEGTFTDIGGIPLAWGTATFMFLSALFQSALGWQIFANTLVG